MLVLKIAALVANENIAKSVEEGDQNKNQIEFKSLTVYENE